MERRGAGMVERETRRSDDPAGPGLETQRLARDEYERPLYGAGGAALAQEEPRLVQPENDLSPEASAAHAWERTRADELMTRRVTTAHPSTSVERAAHLMQTADCGALPVIGDDGLLVGIVTDRDIALRVVGRGRDSRRAIVADCMTERVFACYSHETLAECMRQMARHRLRRLPIVNESGWLVGILTQADLARRALAPGAPDDRRALIDLIGTISGSPESHR
jgi:CBS domain-containing protein